MEKKQTTVKDAIVIDGIGLHSGTNVKIKINPTIDDTGILFRYFKFDEDKAIEESVLLSAKFDRVFDCRLGTNIKNDEITVLTIEHLMAALCLCKVDNAIIDVDDIKQEIPILDGSAKPFVDKIRSIGLKNLRLKRKHLKILKKVSVENSSGCSITIEPADRLIIDMNVEFNYGSIGKQHCIYSDDQNDLVEEIIRARTFCNVDEIEYMHSHNLALGGSFDNAMVFDKTKLLNENGFRCENEVVKHKLLDCIGDMYSSGYSIIGKIVSTKGGHELNNRLLRSIFSDRSNYKII